MFKCHKPIMFKLCKYLLLFKSFETVGICTVVPMTLLHVSAMLRDSCIYTTLLKLPNSEWFPSVW